MQSHSTDPIKKRCLLSVALAWGVALLSFLAIWHVNAWTIYETAINSNFGVPANVPVTFQRFNPVTGTPLVTTQTKLVAGVLSVPTIATGLYHVDIGAIRVNIIVPAGTGTNTLTELATYALNFSILTTTNIYKAKISSTDTNAAFLNQSLLAGTGITITTNNPGADETLTISAGAGAVGDGNKGDIIVSGSGTNWIRTDSILRYGAIVNDGLSDTAAIVAGILANTNTTLYFPPGEYHLDGGTTEILLIEHAVNLLGAGTKATKFVVKPTVGATTDIIRWHPPVGVAMSHLFMRGIEIVAESGNPGRDGIVIDTTDQGMAYTYFEDVNVLTQLGGYGFRLVNPTLTDGWFISALRDCRFAGGIFLQRAGDNITVENCNLYGNGWGFDASFVAGASSTLLLNNNLTSKAGQIRIGGGAGVNLIGNNCEWPQSGTTAIAGDPLVKIDGAGDQVITLSMIGNTLYAAGVADTDGIETTYVKPGSVFIGNRITVAGTGTKIQEAYAHYFDDETGGIGFGTTIPATFGDYVLQWNTNGPMKTVLRNINTGTNASADLGLNGYGDIWWFSAGSASNNANALTFKLDTVEQARMTTNGNLAIGINDPDPYGRLVVASASDTTVRSTVKSSGQGTNAGAEFVWNAYGNSWGMRMGSVSNNANSLTLSLDALGTPVPMWSISTNGFIGVGTTNPISLLHLSAIEPAFHMEANGVGNFRTTYGSDGIVRLTLDSAANTNILTISDNGIVGVGVTPDANARLQTSSFSAPQIDQAPLIVTIANGETLTLDTRTNLYRVKATGAAWTIAVPASAPSTNHEGFRIDVTNTVATVATFDKTLHRTAFTNGVDSVTNSLSTANFSMWVRPALDGALVFNLLDATDDDFSRSSGSSSGGISGLTTGTLPYADSATTLADSPMTRDDAYTVRAANINATTNISTASITTTNTGSFGSVTVATNLTVATTTLVATNNRVGIGTASPASRLHVYGTSPGFISRYESDNANNYNVFLSTTGQGEYGILNDGLYFQALDNLANGIVFYGSTASAGDLKVLASGQVQHLATTDSTSKDTGGAIFEGGVGIEKTGFFGTGVASTPTDTAVTIDSSGWTNTFGKNATVFLEFTNAVWTVYNNAGTAVFTNGLTVGPFILTVPLQVSGKIIVTTGGVSGRAVPF